MSQPNDTSEDRIIELTRVIDAPRALVFAAFTDVAHLDQWWGPRGFTVATISADIRVGGTWRFVMTGPDGTVFPNRIAYREIVADERLVYDHDSDVGDAEDPHRFFVTITFTDEGGKTRVTMRSLFASAERRRVVVSFGAIELGKTTLEKLEQHARKLERATFAPGELRLHRSFEAPLALVYAAFTEPAGFSSWFGPDGVSMPVCELDVRPGGAICFVHAIDGGASLWLRGSYREVVPPSRLVFDLTFTDEAGLPSAPPGIEGWPAGAVIETTVLLSEIAGRTSVAIHQRVTPADAALAPGVAAERRLAREGWSSTLDRLARLLSASP